MDFLQTKVSVPLQTEYLGLWALHWLLESGPSLSLIVIAIAQAWWWYQRLYYEYHHLLAFQETLNLFLGNHRFHLRQDGLVEMAFVG